ncbi:MAG: esterase [Clostridia bacterium]|nr:esterase [Clostridia bacterium]
MPTLTLFSRGTNGPDLYFCADHGEAEQVCSLLCQGTDQPFRLLAFQVEDWNRDLSPWPAPPVFRDQAFAGEARQTLQWLRQNVDPSVPRRCIGGYSLAGLFSLWAFYETDLFTGAASCSGSLWFPGWTEYAQSKSAPQGGALYLSLGEKEPKARNPQMARVGVCTEAQYALAQSQGLDTTFRWHPGGHFQDPEARMAAGFLWLLEQLS